MNEVIRTIMDRKSIRTYEAKDISEEEKRIILEAACAAPTAGNQQMYTIIDVTDQSIKDKLVHTCDHQEFIAEAKMVLIFCADVLKWHEGFMDCNCGPRDQGSVICFWRCQMPISLHKMQSSRLHLWASAAVTSATSWKTMNNKENFWICRIMSFLV